MLLGRTLGFYFSRQFIKTIFLVFATVFTLVYTLDFVELMRRAGDAPGATTGVIAQLALFRTPAIAEQVMPFAVLFGSMAALLQLSRKLELVVARAAGISAWQFLQPGLLIALLIGIVSVTVYNPVSAVLKQRASTWRQRFFHGLFKTGISRSGFVRGAWTDRPFFGPSGRQRRPQRLWV
jgi:lipopolysaccharide export system permease protein